MRYRVKIDYYEDPPFHFVVTTTNIEELRKSLTNENVKRLKVTKLEDII